MPKLRIVHKGLILVGVPLLFGIAFISMIFFGLSQTYRLLERELLLKDAMVTHVTSMTCNACSSLWKVKYAATHDPYIKQCFSTNKERAQAADIHLNKLLKNEPSINPTLVHKANFHLFSFNGPSGAGQNVLSNSALLKQLQQRSEQQTRTAQNAVKSLSILLCGGLSFGVFISFVLGTFFRLNITNRLLIIVSNTVKLKSGESLNPSVKGADEISDLDKFLCKAATEIRELERFKKEMIGIVSHELKSPLSSVGIFLTSLGSGVYGELNAKALDKVQRTSASVKRLMGLVSELLVLDCLELEMKPEEISIDVLFSASVDTVKELAEQSGVEIQVKNIGGRVYADRNRLVQVIVNLLSNAMKFSPSKGRVTLEGKFNEGFFECSVSDQGRGIPESFRKQIFEPFKQVDSTDAITKKGTGLGLTISRSIVEQHGGQIGVDSEEGKGSTFWFKIPTNGSSSQVAVKQIDKVTSPAYSDTGSQTSSKMRSRKFDVLQQGLVIISVPLIFQISFALLIGYMANNILQETRKEEKSLDMINATNRAVDAFVGVLGPGMVYVYTKNQAYSKSVDNGVTEVRFWLNKALQLSKGDQVQAQLIAESGNCVEEMLTAFKNEINTGESRVAFEKMNPTIKSMFYQMSGVQNPEGSSEAQAFSMTLMNDFRNFCNDRVHREVDVPFIKFWTDHGKIMDRERKKGKKISVQRAHMIQNLEITLFAGIALTIILSIYIAVFLMRNITNRLQHVMFNTSKLMKREPLDAPNLGSDEIAYLDRVLFETGSHLLELEKFKQELISIVSHELRTPLMAISSSLQLFQMAVLGELSEKGKKRLTIANGEANRLIRLINDLLDIEKMEAGKFLLDYSTVDLADTINACKSAVAQLAEQKGIKLESTVPDGEATIWADRDRLSQVLINLLSNAIKYSPEGELIQILVNKTSQEQMRFSVTDQGRGIPGELRQKIFDRFVQVAESDATERGGTGLGLAISKTIIEQHGGNIGVDSEVERGSTFWFTLPTKALDVCKQEVSAESPVITK